MDRRKLCRRTYVVRRWLAFLFFFSIFFFARCDCVRASTRWDDRSSLDKSIGWQSILLIFFGSYKALIHRTSSLKPKQTKGDNIIWLNSNGHWSSTAFLITKITNLTSMTAYDSQNQNGNSNRDETYKITQHRRPMCPVQPAIVVYFFAMPFIQFYSLFRLFATRYTYSYTISEIIVCQSNARCASNLRLLFLHPLTSLPPLSLSPLSLSVSDASACEISRCRFAQVRICSFQFYYVNEKSFEEWKKKIILLVDIIWLRAVNGRIKIEIEKMCRIKLKLVQLAQKYVFAVAVGSARYIEIRYECRWLSCQISTCWKWKSFCHPTKYKFRLFEFNLGSITVVL